MNTVKDYILKFIYNNDLRDYENKAIINELPKNKKEISILDAGCGSGLLLNQLYEAGFTNLHGFDLNPVNVDLAIKNKNLKIKLGNVLSPGYEKDSFDIVICSHVLQIFNFNEAQKLFIELGKILKPGGILIICTLNDFKRFFKHPENCRPYPPDSIFRLINNITSKVSAPLKDLDTDFPKYKFLKIWKRYNPLFFLESRDNSLINKFGIVLNTFQYKYNIINTFSYNAYIMFLEKFKN